MSKRKHFIAPAAPNKDSGSKFSFFKKPNNVEDFIKLIIKLLLALALFTPLIYQFNYYFPYIVPKNLAFRALIEIAMALYLFLLVRNKTYWPKFNKGFPIFILFVFALFVSSLMGNNFAFSYWSNFERMDGLVNWLHLIAYVFTLMGVLRSRKEWREFFDLFLGVSWIVALYGLFQYFEAKGIFEIDFIRSDELRIFSTFGNAAYLGSYMMIAIMLTFYLLVYRISKGWAWFSKNFWYIIYYASSIVVFLIVMIFSQTRASLLGLLVFSFLMFVFYLWFNKSRRNKFYYAALAIFLLGFVFIGFLFQQRNEMWVQENSLLNRMTSFSIDATTLPRLLTWQNSLQGFKEKPIFGWGEENFKYVYDKYFPIGVYQHQSSEVWFDRPHNILLQHLIHGGILGLGLYLAMFTYLMFVLFRNYRKNNSKNCSFFKLIFKKRNHWFFNYFWMSFLIAFLIHDFFIFDNLNVNVILYLILAYLFTIGVRVNKPSEPKFNFGGQRDYVFGAIILLIWLNVFVFNIYNPYKANTGLIGALNMSAQAQNVEQAQAAADLLIESGEKTSLGDKENTEIAVRMMNVFSQNRFLSNEDKGQVLGNFANFVNERLNYIVEKYPDDVRIKMFLVQFYGNIKNYDGAIEQLEEIKEYAPQRPESYINLMQYYLQMGRVQEAEENIEYYASIIPEENNNTYVYWNAFQVNLYANDTDDLRKYLDLIVAANQRKYGKDFLQDEISTLNQFLTVAETNDNLEIAALINSYIH